MMIASSYLLVVLVELFSPEISNKVNTQKFPFIIVVVFFLLFLELTTRIQLC